MNPKHRAIFFPPAVAAAPPATFLRITSLEGGLVESGSGPYVYTADTYGRRGHASNLKMITATASYVRMKFDTLMAGDPRFALAVGTNNGTDAGQFSGSGDATNIIELHSQGDFGPYIFASGTVDGAGQYVAADMRAPGMEWRISRDGSNNFQSAWSTDGSSWTNFGAAYAGGASDYFVKITVGTGAPSPGSAVSLRHSGMV